MNSKKFINKIATNRRAYFDYEIIKKFEAGLVLTGNEIKLIRIRAVNIKNSFAVFRHQELFLFNMHLGLGHQFNFMVSDPDRSRKLLLHKQELCFLQQQVNEQKLLIIPLQLYFKGAMVKIEIALARPRKKYDKRKIMDARELARNLQWKAKNWKRFKK